MNYEVEVTIILCNFFSDDDITLNTNSFGELNIFEMQLNEKILEYLRINAAQIISTDFMRSLYNRNDRAGSFYKVLRYRKKVSIKKNIDKYFDENENDFLKEVENIEKYFRMITNLHIMLGTVSLVLYKNNEKISSTVLYREYQSILRYTSKEYLNIKRYNRILSHTIDVPSFNLIQEKIKEFKNSINYYNNSFEQTDISLEFLLLISSLEALFNNNKKRIAFKVRHYGSKFLLDDEKFEENKKVINKMYELRSKYVHGKVFTQDLSLYVVELREKVRMIIINYFLIAIQQYDINNTYKHENVIKFFINPNKAEKNKLKDIKSLSDEFKKF